MLGNHYSQNILLFHKEADWDTENYVAHHRLQSSLMLQSAILLLKSFLSYFHSSHHCLTNRKVVWCLSCSKCRRCSLEMSFWPLPCKEEKKMCLERLNDWRRGQEARSSDSHHILSSSVTCYAYCIESILEKSYTPPIPRTLIRIGLQSKFSLL